MTEMISPSFTSLIACVEEGVAPLSRLVEGVLVTMTTGGPSWVPLNRELVLKRRRAFVTWRTLSRSKQHMFKMDKEESETLAVGNIKIVSKTSNKKLNVCKLNTLQCRTTSVTNQFT